MAGMSWSQSSYGGAWYNVGLSKHLRYVTQRTLTFRGYARTGGVEDVTGKNRGDSYQYTIMKDVEARGGKLNENQPMPQTAMQSSKSTGTLDEWGNSIPFTGKLSDLAVYNPKNETQRALRTDMRLEIDTACADALKETYLQVVVRGNTTLQWYTDATPVLDASHNITVNTFKQITDAAFHDYRIPPYFEAANEFVCICTRKFLSGLRDDPEFIEVKKYENPKALLRGEVGTFQNTRIIETNNTYALTNVGTNDVCGEALFFGADPLIEAVAVPEHVRSQSADYDRARGVAWYMIAGWDLAWQETATAGEVKVIYVTSAT